jgi:hypothetical protein
VSPGKNTPIVTTFLDDPEKLTQYDEFNTLGAEATMTEKIKNINEKYVLHVRPIAFFSKTFSDSQVKNYVAMEKEFLALMLSIQNFRDYISVVPITFVLTDSQPVCWLLRHKDDNIKLSRWLLKIFEFRINIVVTHVAGNRNNIPDFLSRMYYVPEVKSKDGVELTPKAAQHIQSPFSPLAVLTRDDILRDFHKDVVSPCNQPLLLSPKCK